MTIENPTTKLAPVFNETFKFKIGETVQPRHLYDVYAAELELNGPRRDLFDSRIGGGHPLQIVERIMMECHGGIQLLYAVAGYQNAKAGGMQYNKMFEYELCSMEEFMDVARKHMPAKKVSKDD